MATRTVAFTAKGYDLQSAVNVPGNVVNDSNSSDNASDYVKEAILAGCRSLGPDLNGLLNKTFTISYAYDDAGTNGLAFTIAIS